MVQYTICNNDTFWNLAQRYGCTVEQICAANPGVIPAALQIGQVVNIPVGEAGMFCSFHPFK